MGPAGIKKNIQSFSELNGILFQLLDHPDVLIVGFFIAGPNFIGVLNLIHFSAFPLKFLFPGDLLKVSHLLDLVISSFL